MNLKKLSGNLGKIEVFQKHRISPENDFSACTDTEWIPASGQRIFFYTDMVAGAQIGRETSVADRRSGFSASKTRLS
jgi:hypothetical protein